MSHSVLLILLLHAQNYCEIISVATSDAIPKFGPDQTSRQKDFPGVGTPLNVCLCWISAIQVKLLFGLLGLLCAIWQI